MSSQTASKGSGGTAITIGNFDGVHVGHAALVRACRSAVGASGRVLVMSFDPHPASTLAPGRAPPRLTSFARRSELLMSLGADEVVRLEPSRDLLDLSPEQFVDQVLLPRSPSLVVEGDDFHFGKGRAGNNRILAQLGAARGFVVEVVSPVEVALDDQLQVRASSTVARWLIGNGRVRDAATVFGRPYTVEGITRKGDQRGRTIGYPTANVHSDHLLPADGVYGGTITLADRTTHRAAINVGSRPTFGGTERRIEVFAMDAQGGPAALPAAYDWPALVTFEHWVREDLRFHSLEGLVGQIGRDVRTVQGMPT